MHGPFHKPSGGTAGLSSSAKRISREKHCWTSRQCHPSRVGFTLVELLITITIIGILAAGVLAALQSARETAKAAKTKSTITKLHYVIMARYDSYRTRRVPVDVKKYVTSHAGNFYTGWKYTRAYAHARLMIIRDLMRMEMPDRRSDLDQLEAKYPPPNPKKNPPEEPLTPLPSITNRYLRLYNKASTVGQHPSAEFLYMIVMAIPEAAEQFSSTEIADTDNNGLPEFVDGWGHPIKMLRWPVGFLPDDSTVGGVTVTHGAISDLQDTTAPDPFDPLDITGSKATFPLIYSAGPDGEYDINTGYGYHYTLDSGNLNPCKLDDVYLIGQPLRRDSSGTAEAPDPSNLHHYDNIHNHILEVR